MDNKVIQSYVWFEGKCFFVSTINRESSAMIEGPIRYNETMAWECDPLTNKRGEMLPIQEGGPTGSLKAHFRVCESLAASGEYLDD